MRTKKSLEVLEALEAKNRLNKDLCLWEKSKDVRDLYEMSTFDANANFTKMITQLNNE